MKTFEVLMQVVLPCKAFLTDPATPSVWTVLWLGVVDGSVVTLKISQTRKLGPLVSGRTSHYQTRERLPRR